MDQCVTVTVRYSCHLCGISGREVAVRARTDEDVVRWMEDVCIMAVARDHASASPDCRAESISDLLIPVSAADKVGGASLQ